MPILEAHDIVKGFRIPSVKRSTLREHVLGLLSPRSSEELVVLDGVSLTIESGETLGIMGRNGSGKSTLLKILSGIYLPDRGRVIARGAITPILELGAGWNPELDAIDNILLLGSIMGMSLRELRLATDEILAFAELERFANLKLHHYSSGMASRLAYSVAFTAVRDVLILDEVFAVGDAAFKRRCEERYRALHAAGTTVIIVSHDPRTISDFCARGLLLDSGRIVAIDDGPQVATRYLNLLTNDVGARASDRPAEPPRRLPA